jgi:hypothetical protein
MIKKKEIIENKPTHFIKIDTFKPKPKDNYSSSVDDLPY